MAPEPSEAELAEATEALYTLDPNDFVPARNELVRSLRSDGKRELAKAVGQLRRPTLAAWAVNQLTRRHRPELEGLLRLGDALRAAQTQTLAGADAADLRQAARTRRDAVAALADIATAFLSERGAGVGAHQGEIVATLEAASLDPQAAAEVAGGRLSSALEPPSGFGDFGFGDLGFGVASPSAGPPSPAAGEQQAVEEPETAEADRLSAELAEAESAAFAAAQRAADLAVNAVDARALVAERRRKAEAAEAEVIRLQQAWDEARGRAEAAAQALEQAEHDADLARAAAAEAEEHRAEAERRLADLRSGGGEASAGG